MAFPQYVSDTNPTGTVLYLTSLAEIQQEFSTKGIRLHIDDMVLTDTNYDSHNDSDVVSANYITTLLQRATSHVMSYLAPRYAIADIYQIPRLREIATYWACYKLSKRRGNDALYQEDYAEGQDDLEDYRDGTKYLAAPSNGRRAYMQSGIVDLRFTQRPYRTIPLASSSVQSGQGTTLYTPFWWL